jgi:hypothetical protein
LQTGKITGCKKGSYVWWHEKGHLVFNQTELGSKIEYYQQHFMMVAVSSIVLGTTFDTIYSMPLKVFALLNATGMMVSYLYQEIWCWMYARRNFFNKQ